MITFVFESFLVVFQGITHGVVGRGSVVVVDNVRQLRDEFFPDSFHKRCPLAGSQEDVPVVSIEPAAIGG